MTPEQLLAGGGTAALILAGLYAIRELWGDHKRRDLRIEQERDDALQLVRAFSDAVPKIAEGVNSLTRTVEKLAARRRAYDGDSRPKPPDG